MKEHLTVIDHPLVQHKLTSRSRKRRRRELPAVALGNLHAPCLRGHSQDLPLTTVNVDTPLCRMRAPILDGKKLALISILRAGNGLLDGILEVIPAARVGFVGMYRDEETLEPVEYYCKVPPELDKRLVIAVDPMLATGKFLGRRDRPFEASGANDLRMLLFVGRPRRRSPHEGGPPGRSGFHRRSR